MDWDMKKTKLIKDIRIYNPTKQSNRQLAKDWETVADWYKQLKENKKFVYTEEDVLNVARLIYLEMMKRIKKGIVKYVFRPERMKPYAKELYLKVRKPIIGQRDENDYLPIFPGGIKPRYKLMTVEDFTKRWKSFVLKEPCVYLVGSLPNWNISDGDIDIVIRDTEDSQNFERIKWRIQRAFPDLKDRLQFHDDSWHGQFTNYVNLGKLMIQAPEDYRVMKMEDMEKDEFQLRTKEVSVIKEAEISKKEDRLKMFRFFFPLKGIHGYRVGEKYRVEQVVTFFKPEDYPLVTQKKYDGNRQIIFKQGEKVEIWSEDGTEVTDRMPKTVAELKRIDHPRDFILDSETEMWVGKEHQSREVTAGYLHRKDKPDDSGLVVNVFDMLYCYDPGIKKHDLNLQAGDIHNEEHAMRLKYLDTVPFKQSTIGVPNPSLSHLNRTPDYISDRSAKLIQDIRTNSKAIASEGAMIKSSHSTYPLTGMTSKWVKFKTMVEIHAKIWKRNPTKTKGVYNYDVCLRVPTGVKVDPKYIIKFKDNPNTYLKVGRSYNTKTFAKPGQICTLSIHTLNVYRNPETGEIRVHVYEPRWYELRPEQTEPDSIVEAIRTAREAKVLQIKKVGSEQLEDPFLEYPPEGWVGRYVVQHHYRAGIDPKLKPKEKPLASAHVDARFELPDYLVGMTWADQMKGMVPDVRTMQEAKKIDKNIDAFKIDWGKGLFKKIKTAAGRIVPREILAIPKAREPREWLFFEGVVKEGSIGATRFGPGVFTIIDKGKVEWGTQKCLVGDTKIIVQDKYGRIRREEIRQTVEREENVKVLTPSGFSYIKHYIKKPVGGNKVLKIILENGCSFIADEKHPTLKLDERTNRIGKILVGDLKVGNKIPINNGYDFSDRGTYEMGKLLGLFLAEGDKRSLTEKNENISFAFNSSEIDLVNFIVKYGKKLGCSYRIDKNTQNNGISLVLIQAGALIGIVRQFVNKDKSLKSCIFGLSKRCREGIIDGVTLGDGTKYPSYRITEMGNIHRKLMKDLADLCASIGLIYSIHDYGSRLRISHHLSNSNKGYWHTYHKGKQRFIKVKSIEERFPNEKKIKWVYDFELENDHRIVLANGIITSNTYYHEYFLYGDKLKGRIVYRLLPAGKYRRIGEQKYFWVVIQPIEQEPYVLSRRAVTKKWIPPLGHSALPDSVKKQIPKDYHYWDTRVKTKADAMKIRDELVEMIKKKEIKIDYNKIRTEEPPATTKKLEAELALSRDYFILQHTWVRGQKVIRVGPSAEHWDLALRGTRPKKDRWILLSNPVETDKNASVHEPWTAKEWNNHAVVIPKSIKEPLLCPPGHPLNFKKTADVFVQTLDYGYCTILDKKQGYMKIRFDGKLKNLRGIWILIQETPSEKTWTVERAETIGEPIRKRASLMGENGWLKIMGLAMRPGWFKSKFFSKDVLRAAVLVPRDNERLAPIDIFHSPDKQDRVGVLSRIFWDENVRWKGKDDGKHHVGALMYEGFLFDKPSIDSCVDGKLRKNSVEMIFTGEPVVETLKIDGLGLVLNPAVPEAAATKVSDDKTSKTF